MHTYILLDPLARAHIRTLGYGYWDVGQYKFEYPSQTNSNVKSPIINWSGKLGSHLSIIGPIVPSPPSNQVSSFNL
jgi:hypothetical protein